MYQRPRSAHDLPMICPWSAHDLPMICPYIYRGLPSKCAKNFVLVNFFRFSKNREKSQKTQGKSGFLGHFLLIKTAFFLKRSSQKRIIKTIISYTTNAPLFHWKTVRKCLHVRHSKRAGCQPLRKRICKKCFQNSIFILSDFLI